jgi:hypothetical protein
MLVIEGEAERVPEGHQGPLHGIGLGLLEGGFMGLAQIHVNAVASAAPLADQRHQTAGRDRDAHAGGVGDTPARLLVPARASGTDQSFGLGDTADGDGLALPAIEAKDAVRFRDHLPTLQVTHSATALLPLADVGSIEGSGEGSELFWGEAGGMSLGSGASFWWGLFGAVSRADQLQGRWRPLAGSRRSRAAGGAGPVGGRSGDGHGDGSNGVRRRGGPGCSARTPPVRGLCPSADAPGAA